ncbi:MAG: AAA family ATPase, partial [Pseudomonadota bacterium]
HQYVEVYEAVKQVYSSELRRVERGGNRLNTHVISAAFLTFADLLSETNEAEIEEFVEDFNTKYEDFADELDEEAMEYVRRALAQLRSQLASEERVDLLHFDGTPESNRTGNNVAGNGAEDLANGLSSALTGLLSGLGGVEGSAQASGQADNESAEEASDENKTLRERILELGELGEIMVKGTADFIRDTRDEAREQNEHLPIIGRDKEITEVLTVLARLKGMNAFLKGPAGAGKTAIAWGLDDWAAEGRIPKNLAFAPIQEIFVIETTPARIGTLAKSNDDNSQAAAIELYVEAVMAVQKQLGITMPIYIDEAHQLGDAQIEALKRYMDSRSGPHFIFSSTSQEANMKFSNNRAFNRRTKDIPIAELSNDVIFGLLNETWVPKVQQKYGVEIPADTLQRIVDEAGKVLPDNGTLDGSIKMLQDIGVIHAVEDEESEVYSISREDTSEFIKQFYALPVDPNNAAEFVRFLESLKEDLKSEVVDQDRMIEDIVDLYGNLIRNKRKNVAVAMAIGTTGVGKTLLGTKLAEHTMDNKNAFFEINGNEFTSSHRLDALLGAPNGFVSSDKTPGALMEWLDDLAQGGRGGFILINEIDKMAMEGVKRFMEAWDRGKISGGDGKTRTLKNVMFIITSNRNASMIFPDVWPTWTAQEMKRYVESLDSDELKEKTTYNTSDGEDDKKMAVEVMNRIDLFTVATPITRETASRIAAKYSESLIDEYVKDFGVRLEINEEVIERIVQSSYNHMYGARPIIRAMDNHLQ